MDNQDKQSGTAVETEPLKSAELLQILSPSMPKPAAELIEEIYGIPENEQTDEDAHTFRLLVQRTRQRGWEIFNSRAEGYSINRDHYHLLDQVIRMSGMQPKWKVLPGPIELLQIFESIETETGQEHI